MISVKWFSILVLLLNIETVWAAAGAHGSNDIPWGTIVSQVVNLSILIFVLVYLLKKKASDHFKERSASYQALLTRAEAAQKEAEENKKEIYERLQKLEQNAEATVSQARIDAAELKAKILEDAQNLAKKLKEESKRTADFEIQRAKEEIRKELLQEAIQDARKAMESGVEGSDQKRLQSEFVQRVQVVGQ